MFTYLDKSGLPIHLNGENHALSFDPPLRCEDCSRKSVGQMAGMWKDGRGISRQVAESACYEFYRDIRFPKDEQLFRREKTRFDITVVRAGGVNGECKKTSGHYHGFCHGSLTYPEIYSVVHGVGIYILQKAWNFDKDPTCLLVDDILIVRAEEGQSVLIPPNYGHCTINGGEDLLVSANLASSECDFFYEPVQFYHGMGYYIIADNGTLSAIKNPHYESIALPEPRFVSAKEDYRLGLDFARPLYESYVNNHLLFSYLSQPGEFELNYSDLFQPADNWEKRDA